MRRARSDTLPQEGLDDRNRAGRSQLPSAIIKFVSGAFLFLPFVPMILPRQGEVAPKATEGEDGTAPRRFITLGRSASPVAAPSSPSRDAARDESCFGQRPIEIDPALLGQRQDNGHLSQALIARLHSRRREARIVCARPSLSYVLGMPGFFQGLYVRLRELLDSGVGLILLLFIMAALLFVALGNFAPVDYGQVRREGQRVDATIMRIGVAGSKYSPYMRSLTVRDRTGTDHFIAVPIDMIAGCKVGDRVMAVRSDLDFTLQPLPCRRNHKT